MANADSPDPSADLVPVGNKEGEEVDPVAPAPEPKLPTRKDASLKEFLSKMDDYAPIVNLLPSIITTHLTYY
jgi:transcription initiation factor TFIID subunit 10